MSKKEKKPKAKAAEQDAPVEKPKKKRRWRLGDRSDGYKVRTINPMNKMMPYIMPQRCDACNTYADMFDVTKTDKYCREKVKEGRTNFGFLHVLIAAYLRAISQRPGINRFVSGLAAAKYSRGLETVVPPLRGMNATCLSRTRRSCPSAPMKLGALPSPWQEMHLRSKMGLTERTNENGPE